MTLCQAANTSAMSSKARRHLIWWQLASNKFSANVTSKFSNHPHHSQTTVGLAKEKLVGNFSVSTIASDESSLFCALSRARTSGSIVVYVIPLNDAE